MEIMWPFFNLNLARKKNLKKKKKKIYLATRQ